MSTTRSSADLNQSNENTALIVRTTQPTYGSATAEPNQASTTSAEEITEEENDNIIEINTADYAHVTEEEEDNFTWDWVWIADSACGLPHWSKCTRAATRLFFISSHSLN